MSNTTATTNPTPEQIAEAHRILAAAGQGEQMVPGEALEQCLAEVWSIGYALNCGLDTSTMTWYVWAGAGMGANTKALFATGSQAEALAWMVNRSLTETGEETGEQLGRVEVVR